MKMKSFDYIEISDAGYIYDKDLVHIGNLCEDIDYNKLRNGVEFDNEEQWMLANKLQGGKK